MDRRAFMSLFGLAAASGLWLPKSYFFLAGNPLSAAQTDGLLAEFRQFYYVDGIGPQPYKWQGTESSGIAIEEDIPRLIAWIDDG